VEIHLKQRTEEDMMRGPSYHELQGNMPGTVAAKISNTEYSKETKQHLSWATANALELVGTVIDFKL
jgi:hypothetical protein